MYPHLTSLNLERVLGKRKRPVYHDPALEALRIDRIFDARQGTSEGDELDLLADLVEKEQTNP